MELIHLVPGLRVLDAVAARGGFSAAASALGMTQSAVSQHVAALERHVGQQLVHRGTRPVELTAAGQLLAGHGHAVTARLAAAGRDLEELTQRTSRRLRFGSFPTALATFVPRAIARLRAQLPDTVLTVTDDHMQRLVPRLRDRELDLAVVFDDGFTDLDETVTIPLFADTYRLVLPRHHRLATATRDPSLRDLKKENWVGGASDSSWFRIVRLACREVGVEPRVALGSDDYVAVQAFVAAGLGIAVVPGLAAARTLPGVRVRPLRGTAPVRHVAVAHPDSSYVSPTALAMVRILQQSTRNLR